MIIRYPEPLKPTKDRPAIETVDGGDTWDWKCPRCGKKHKEEGPLGFGDLVVCNNCESEFVDTLEPDTF
jgi:hypothetical protein